MPKCLNLAGLPPFGVEYPLITVRRKDVAQMQQVSRKIAKKTGLRFRRARGAFLLTAFLSVTVLVFLVWWGFVLVKQTVLSGLVKTINVQQGIIEDKKVVEGFVFRDETIVPSPAGGTVRYLVAEGERVRLGKTVAEITVPALDNATGSKVIAVRAPVAGVVSYRIDGLENIYSPENLTKLPVEKLTGLYQPREAKNNRPADRVERGQGIFKLVNNLNPGYLYLEVPKAEFKEQFFEEGREISLYLEQDNQRRIYFLIKSLTSEGDYYRVILGINNLPMELYHQRKVTPALVTGRFNGFLVPDQAIVEKGGQPGIYLVYKSAVIWEPVKVVGKVNGDVAVKADSKKLPKGIQSRLAPNASVIVNPGYVEEGQAVN